jgi:hypothetical protein
MNIPFNAPHLVSSSVLESDKAYGVAAFRRCLERLRKVTDVSLVRSGHLYVFCFPDAFEPNSNRTVNSIVLRHLLDCLIALNMGYLDIPVRNRPVITTLPLYSSGVRYDRDPEWMTIESACRKKLADCKTLTAYMIAQLRKQNRFASPVFRWVENSQDGQDFHILVEVERSREFPTGYTDPSKVLGMGSHENAPRRAAH